MAALEMLKAAGDPSPSETPICGRLHEMWKGGARVGGSAKHIANLRRAMRESGETEPVRARASSKR